MLNVKRILAVHSCKGGVGKSTISVALALTLASQSDKIGLCDLDICGPSIVELLGLDREPVRWKEVDRSKHRYSNHSSEQKIVYEEDVNIHLMEPKIIQGVKVMSCEFLASKYDLGYNAYRGPIIDQLCYEMIYKTNWSDLDYLILDTPPGTSDVLISLTESIHIDGAILVTTPHVLSVNDVIRGIKLFKEFEVPILAMVENMSYYKCDSCDSIKYIFGKTKIDELCTQFLIENCIKLPLMNTGDCRGTLFKSQTSTASILNLCIISDYYDVEEVVNSFNMLADVIKNYYKIHDTRRIEPRNNIKCININF